MWPLLDTRSRPLLLLPTAAAAALDQAVIEIRPGRGISLLLGRCCSEQQLPCVLQAHLLNKQQPAAAAAVAVAGATCVHIKADLMNTAAGGTVQQSSVRMRWRLLALLRSLLTQLAGLLLWRILS